MSLPDELHRTLKDKFNHVEPSRIATVVSATNNTAKIRFPEEDLDPFEEVPVIQPAYGTVQPLNLTEGDQVLVAFLEGKFITPIIIGKVIL